MAALNRFISRLGERGLPFFKLLKHQDKFQWMEEAERALQDLKHHLQSPPILTAPLPGEDLLLYIAATTHVVSSAIVVERGVQRPVYFVSDVLSESKVWYPAVQKLLYAILIASRKLRHYFEPSSTHCNQIPSSSRFYGRMEGESSSNSSRQARALDHVL
jgi:hypothetical protein